jgi:hypothetical protein
MIHEELVNNPDPMTNEQFPMTNRRPDAVYPLPRIRSWSFAIGIWSFPQDSRVVFANDAG